MSNAAVWVLDVESFSDAELAAAAVLQGLANRDGPRVYLDMAQRHWQMTLDATEHPLVEKGVHHSPETVAKYRSCTSYWIEYYGRTQGLAFTPAASLEALAETFRDRIAGTLLYDMQDTTAEYIIAVNLATLRNALPVTADVLRRHPALANLPVLADLRGKHNDRLASQRWAVKELLPQFSKHAVYSQTRTANEADPDYFGLDLVVSQKLFAFSLGFRQAKTPEEFSLVEEILSQIEPMSPMYGWGTSEDSMMIGMAKGGHFLVCTHTPNISFHAHMKPTAFPMKQKRQLDRSKLKLQNKHYVTFMVNEGDTLKWMGSVMGHGQWLEMERGTLPVNWGMNAWLVEKYPGLMEAFYRTQTEQDLFFSAITGYGYYNPKWSRATAMLCQKERVHNVSADLHAGSVYAVHGMIDATHGILDPGTDQWLVERGCTGYAFESSQQAYLKFTSANQPVIGTDWKLFYWWYRFDDGDVLDQAAEHIREIARQHEPPFFIPVYGGSPSRFKALAERLPKDQFEIVLLDEMVELAKLAGRIHLDEDHLDLQGQSTGEVTLHIRNMDEAPYAGTVSVQVPEGWDVSPAIWDYATVGERQHQSQTFRIRAPRGAATEATIRFRDSHTGQEDVLRVRPGQARPSRVSPGLGRILRVPQAALTVDGDASKWDDLPAIPTLHDLRDYSAGNLCVQYRFAWDLHHLYLLVEELRGPDRPLESLDGRCYPANEFDIADGVAFWLDTSGQGTCERGDLSLWFGFSSRGRNDLYCALLNDRVLTSPEPAATIATRGPVGRRVIEAAIPWAGMARFLERRRQPAGGLLAALHPGWKLGCQPLVIEGWAGRAFRNGRSNRRQDQTAAALARDGKKLILPPNGFDADSLWLELSTAKDIAPRARGHQRQTVATH